MKFRTFKNKPYWGDHSWSRGSCVDIVDLDAEMIPHYVQYQDQNDRIKKGKFQNQVIPRRKQYEQELTQELSMIFPAGISIRKI